MTDVRDRAVAALGELIDAAKELYFGDIDGCDFRNCLSEHGILIQRAATAEEFADENWWGHEWDVGVGDLVLVTSPEFIKALDEAK